LVADPRLRVTEEESALAAAQRPGVRAGRPSVPRQIALRDTTAMENAAEASRPVHRELALARVTKGPRNAPM